MNEQVFFYVGSYTNMSWSRGEKGKGLYHAVLDQKTGTLTCSAVTEGLINPSYAVFSSDSSHLYVVNEVQPVDEKAVGKVSSFAVDKKSGSLTLLGTTSSFGLSPCYITLDKTGRYAFLTNFRDSVVSLAMNEKDALEELVQIVAHPGVSTEPGGPEEIRPHSVIFDREYRHVIVPDLRIDKVMVYRVDYKDGKPLMVSAGSASVKTGAGPRHATFNKSGNILYLICEKGARLYVFDYDANTGALAHKQDLSTLPEGTDVKNMCADLHLSPDGRFLYGSNRGHDSIVIYKVDPDTGKLSYISNQSTYGNTPRNFSLDPSGRWLIAANQDSNSLVSFAIDPDTGLLEKKYELEIPAPVLVKFL